MPGRVLRQGATVAVRRKRLPRVMGGIQDKHDDEASSDESDVQEEGEEQQQQEEEEEEEEEEQPKNTPGSRRKNTGQISAGPSKRKVRFHFISRID